MRTVSAFRLIPLAAAAIIAACAGETSTNPISSNAATPAVEARRGESDGGGAVYTMTNGTTENEIVAFRRAESGELSPIGSYRTGGAGTGGTIDPLVSQYSLVLSDDHELLFAVNAASNSITSFQVAEDGELAQSRVISSGGTRPVSIAVRRNLLYVLNAGSNTLQGYRIGESGRLAPLPGASAELPAGAAGAAAVRFTRDGQHLIVAERSSNRIDVFAVKSNGRVADVTTFASHGRAAFGFDVTPRNDVIVSETGSNPPNGGVSSYTLRGGALSLVTGSVSSGGAAACWLLNTQDGRFSYVVNSASATIGAFAVSRDGSVSSIGGSAALTSTGANSVPLDPAFSAGDKFLYVLEGRSGDISGFAVGEDGALTPASAVRAGAGASGLQGLAAF